VRVISVCGPSVFEAICRVAPFDKQSGFLNMITDAYHWHFAASRLGHLQSFDEVHARSGRRVLFFTLREAPELDPFLRIYVYRAPGDEFAAEVLRDFATAHSELAAGVQVDQENK